VSRMQGLMQRGAASGLDARPGGPNNRVKIIAFTHAQGVSWVSNRIGPDRKTVREGRDRFLAVECDNGTRGHQEGPRLGHQAPRVARPRANHFSQ
jgi:hypothetical protein